MSDKFSYMFNHEEIKDCRDCPCFDGEYEECLLSLMDLSDYVIPNRKKCGTIPSWCKLVRVINGIYKLKLGG